MTKKLFILILTLCLAVVGMTVVAMADAPTSISIGGTTLSNGDTISGGNGTATYQDGVLTLNNFTVVDNAGYDGISSGGDLTIKFSGENSITSGAGDGIYAYGSLTIIGSEGASLTVSGLLGGIKAKGGNALSISNSVITTNGISSGDSGATMAIEDSTIVSTEEIYASSSITISGNVDITAVGGIDSDSNSITPATGGILEVTVGSTTSYISSATTLSSTYDTVIIQPHTHSYVNNECACGAKDYGTVNIGNATLSDGQYAIANGYNVSVYDGTPTGTSYAYFSGGVLYLNNFSYGSAYGISCYNDLTINLTGTNSITGTGIVVLGSLSIGGTGSLTMTTENYGYAAIYVSGNITIKGVTIDVTSNEGFAIAIETQGSVIISGSDVTLSASTTNSGDAAMTIYAYVDIVIENGSTLTATASFAGEKGIARTLYAINSISITDSTVTNIEASGYVGHAMYAQMGAITITNSTVNVSATATADENASDGYDGRAIYAEDGNITIKESTVTATANAYKSYAVYAGGDVAVSGESTVTTTATATMDNGYSCGIYAIGNIAVTGSSTVSSTATGGYGYGDSLAIHSYTGSIDITGSEVTVNVSGYNGYGAISTYEANADITITDSKVIATVNSTDANSVGAIATWDDGSDIIISGSDISITSTFEYWDYGSIFAIGSVSISDSKVYAKSTSSSTRGLIRAKAGATISDSEVELIASGTDATYAIYVTSGDLEIESSDVTLTATSTTAQSAIYVISGDIILTPGSGEALEVTLGTNNPVYYYSATTVEDNAWSSYGYVKIAVSDHTHSYISSVTTEATCTEDGVMTYTCNCGDSYTETIPATGHDYEISYFTWADGYKSATATFACANCSDEQTVDATVSVENYYGMYVYVATARYGASGATYSSIKTSGTVDMSGLETNSVSEVITEEVETTEPVEGTDTETEEDDAELETNPTTGIAVAMLPMAIALAGVVVGKKK